MDEAQRNARWVDVWMLLFYLRKALDISRDRHHLTATEAGTSTLQRVLLMKVRVEFKGIYRDVCRRNPLVSFPFRELKMK